jgi:hypothetical protein
MHYCVNMNEMRRLVGRFVRWFGAQVKGASAVLCTTGTREEGWYGAVFVVWRNDRGQARDLASGTRRRMPSPFIRSQGGEGGCVEQERRGRTPSAAGGGRGPQAPAAVAGGGGMPAPERGGGEPHELIRVEVFVRTVVQVISSRSQDGKQRTKNPSGRPRHALPARFGQLDT